MAGVWKQITDRVGPLFSWISTYLWIIWFILLAVLVYTLRPLKAISSMNLGKIGTFSSLRFPLAKMKAIRPAS